MNNEAIDFGSNDDESPYLPGLENFNHTQESHQDYWQDLFEEVIFDEGLPHMDISGWNDHLGDDAEVDEIDFN